MLIIELPPETLDHIAGALESPVDVRSLAGVCTLLRSLVSPHHTQFRIIRAPLLSPVWTKFADNHSLAQNVRTLEVQSAEIKWNYEGVEEPVIPAIFRNLEAPSLPVAHPEADEADDDDVGALRARDAAKNAADLAAERILVSALKGMAGLTSFQWSRTPPLINPNAEADVWMVLAKYCPLLRSIDVVDREKPYEPLLEDTDDSAYQRPTRNPNFFLFRDLTSFLLQTEAFNVGEFGVPNIERCGKMLVEDCPNLEVLRLRYILYANPDCKAVNANTILTGAHWRSLREIRLFSFDIISTELARFLASHPTLEHLSLINVRVDSSIALLPGTLPCLKRLRIHPGWAITHSILKSAVSVPRPLELISSAPFDDTFLDLLELSGSGPTLKKVSVEAENDLSHLITRLSDIAPNLQWLHLGHSEYLTTRTNRDLFPVFGQLPLLRTLQGIKFLSSACESPSENTEVVRALVKACPNIRRINWYMGNILDLSKDVIIERDGSHVIWSLRRMMGEREGPVDISWGERGQGTFEL
ncbi:hypothetical protein BDZ97DRAFT_1917604 [Flammula alnicola]|nr:hypothetical protein BDZ97DRAFT_1917604 [Flammula alnicola]